MVVDDEDISMYTDDDAAAEDDRDVIWEVTEIRRKEFNFDTMEAVDPNGNLIEQPKRPDPELQNIFDTETSDPEKMIYVRKWSSSQLLKNDQKRRERLAQIKLLPQKIKHESSNGYFNSDEKKYQRHKQRSSNVIIKEDNAHKFKQFNAQQEHQRKMMEALKQQTLNMMQPPVTQKMQQVQQQIQQKQIQKPINDQISYQKPQLQQQLLQGQQQPKKEEQLQKPDVVIPTGGNILINGQFFRSSPQMIGSSVDQGQTQPLAINELDHPKQNPFQCQLSESDEEICQQDQKQVQNDEISTSIEEEIEQPRVPAQTEEIKENEQNLSASKITQREVSKSVVDASILKVQSRPDLMSEDTQNSKKSKKRPRDENGNIIWKLDENGNPIKPGPRKKLDESGNPVKPGRKKKAKEPETVETSKNQEQPTQERKRSKRPRDENGNVIWKLDENGNPLKPGNKKRFDENGNPIPRKTVRPPKTVKYDENGNVIQKKRGRQPGQSYQRNNELDPFRVFNLKRLKKLMIYHRLVETRNEIIMADQEIAKFALQIQEERKAKQRLKIYSTVQETLQKYQITPEEYNQINGDLYLGLWG
uniref:Uncharacterized protein n=1 Tax=Trepomonas sp. PC1 TaxID=1076344 RepID=A0A146KGP3_9EUKA|eukprot:JAP95044.1 Hypothetical protein TPC1_12084 [Trepomonas sp. PC1]